MRIKDSIARQRKQQQQEEERTYKKIDTSNLSPEVLFMEPVDFEIQNTEIQFSDLLESLGR